MKITKVHDPQYGGQGQNVWFTKSLVCMRQFVIKVDDQIICGECVKFKAMTVRGREVICILPLSTVQITDQDPRHVAGTEPHYGQE